MVKKRAILTGNKEIYKKINMLHFSPEIVLQDIKPKEIEKLVKNINKNIKILELEHIGKYTIIKKLNPLNFDIYLSNRK